MPPKAGQTNDKLCVTQKGHPWQFKNSEMLLQCIIQMQGDTIDTVEHTPHEQKQKKQNKMQEI